MMMDTCLLWGGWEGCCKYFLLLTVVGFRVKKAVFYSGWIHNSSADENPAPLQSFHICSYFALASISVFRDMINIMIECGFIHFCLHVKTFS